MTVDYDAIQLGLVLGKNVQTVNDLNQNSFESEGLTNINVIGMMNVSIPSAIRARKRVYDVNAFIVDSSTNCILDSSTLLLDGGYTSDYDNQYLFIGWSNDTYIDSFHSLDWVDDGSTANVDLVNGRIIF